MVKAAVFFHDFLQAAFSGMAERRVAEIVVEGDGFAEFFIEVKAFAKRAGDLRDFNAVGQAGSVVFALMIGKDLRFAVQTAKSRGVNQSVTVALKRRADDIGKIGVKPAAALVRRSGVGCEFHQIIFP